MSLACLSICNVRDGLPGGHLSTPISRGKVEYDRRTEAYLSQSQVTPAAVPAAEDTTAVESLARLARECI